MEKATIEHSMRSVVDALDAKIAELEGYQKKVEDKVRGGHELATNTTALTQITDSLNSAKAARKLMTDSCCIVYSCNFTWQP